MIYQEDVIIVGEMNGQMRPDRIETVNFISNFSIRKKKKKETHKGKVLLIFSILMTLTISDDESQL